MENKVKNGVELRGKGTKFSYILFRLFPPVSFLEGSVPWVKKSKLLIPVAYIYRFFRGATSSKKHVESEIKQLKR